MTRQIKINKLKRISWEAKYLTSFPFHMIDFKYSFESRYIIYPTPLCIFFLIKDVLEPFFIVIEKSVFWLSCAPKTITLVNLKN
ncbi:hypothetical protein BpHYR1_006155 [Brachionus plicatilis]|uniref:Uncharacterized protein n=1 Tax=Brachionus plicatilis TaxID=10195 RepID=A0A3M7RBA1_BRAPC|nr:hypothetical protein BpHYR1_006155 [Brachionus plicatilis]